MQISFPSQINKSIVFDTTENFLTESGFQIINKDSERPWGGFFVIDEAQSDKFFKEFFPNERVNFQKKISPKFLIVEPGKRLSWQYHFRRAELWRVITGDVGIITSKTDTESGLKKYRPDSIIKLKKGERHRLIGLVNWGVVAEIWQHTDKDHPSDEEDIVRLQDDFGR